MRLSGSFDYEEDPYPKERSRARVIFDHKKGLYVCAPSAKVLAVKEATQELLVHYHNDDYSNMFKGFKPKTDFVEVVEFSMKDTYLHKRYMEKEDVLNSGFYILKPEYGQINLEPFNAHREEEYLSLGINVEGMISDMSNFFLNRKIYRDNNIVHKRGCLLYGPPGNGKCLAKGTPVLMFDGTIRSVEDIKVGDLLMGDDSLPRKVRSLARGREEGYKITPVKGDAFTVNKSHILSLKRSGDEGAEIVNLSVEDFLKKSNNFKHHYKLYRTGVEFPEKKLELDPYFLGLWLGDGTSIYPQITNTDPEVINYLYHFARENKLKVTRGKGKCNITYYLASGPVGGKGLPRYRNPIWNFLRDKKLLGNKHIPHEYKTASEKQRLNLLAGLLDTDGHLHDHNCYEYSSKSKSLAEEVAYLCRSLGLAAYISRKHIDGEDYFRVNISGNTKVIPVKIKRKMAAIRRQKKDVLKTGIKSIESVGEIDYFGFDIDANHLFLLGDFTVTHNTFTISKVAQEAIAKFDCVVFIVGEGVRLNNMSGYKSHLEGRNVMFIVEEITNTLRGGKAQEELLSFLDGQTSWNNSYVISTTNSPDDLPGNIVDRPGRFDILVEVPNPEEHIRKKYLTHFLSKEAITDELIRDTKGLSVSYLKELVIQSLTSKKNISDIIKSFRDKKSKISSAFRTFKKGEGNYA